MIFTAILTAVVFVLNTVGRFLDATENLFQQPVTGEQPGNKIIAQADKNKHTQGDNNDDNTRTRSVCNSANESPGIF